jgi:hypothetical protein
MFLASEKSEVKVVMKLLTLRLTSTWITANDSLGIHVYSIFEDDDLDDEPTCRKSNCTGAEETLVFREKDATYCEIRIAPGEGKIAVLIHRHLNAKVLSFPTIYGGVERKFKNSVRITYTDIAKSDIRRYDRRACRPCKLLYSFKRSINDPLRFIRLFKFV